MNTTIQTPVFKIEECKKAGLIIETSDDTGKIFLTGTLSGAVFTVEITNKQAHTIREQNVFLIRI